MPFTQRRTFWLLASTALVCAGAVGGGVWLAGRNVIPTIELKTLPPLPEPNGFDLYAQAGRKFVQANPDIDAWNDVHPASGQVATARYSLQRRQQWLRTNTTAFALFEQAQQTPTRHPDPALDIGLMGFRYGPNYAQYFPLARYKREQETTLLLEKRPFDALQCALDVAQMSFDLRQDAHYQGAYLLPTVTWIGLQPIQTKSAVPEQLSVEQAHAAMARIQTLLKKRPPLTECVAMTHRQVLAGLRQYWKIPDWREGASLVLNHPRNPTMSEAKWHARLLAPTEIVGNINDYYDKVEQIAKRPYSQRVSQMPPLPSEPVSAYSCVRFSEDFIVQETKEKVALDLLLLRLALQAHKLEQGTYPANLTALKSADLASIPVDDFADGAPYHYQRAGKKYKLWSVGPDGIDDGGRATTRSHPDMVTHGKFQRLMPGIVRSDKGDYVAGQSD